MTVTLTEHERETILDMATRTPKVKRVTFHRQARLLGYGVGFSNMVYEARIRRDYKGRPSIQSVKAY